MAATDISNISSTILKTLYSTEAIDDLVLPKSPLLGMMPKSEDFVGFDFHELLEYGDIKGVGAVFATAQTNAAGTDEAKFALTRVKTYAIAQITGEAIEASRGGDKAAFVAVLKRQMDSALSAIGQTLSHQTFRNKYGRRGVVSAITSATPSVITLTNIDDIVNFEKGQKLTASATDGGALRNSGAVDTIASVNRDAGTITMTVNDVSTNSWAASDSLYRDSDRTLTDGTAGHCMSGLDEWLPSTAPTSTAFFGVDRSIDPTRLGGIRYDGSAKNVAEALIGGAYRAARDGASIEKYFLPYANFEELVNLLGAKVQYVTEAAYNNPQVGFKGVQIMGPNGPISVHPDQFCLANIAYGLTMRTWKLHSLNKAPHILDLDSQNLLRLSTSDAYEIRWGAYYQLGCKAPGKNVRVALA